MDDGADQALGLAQSQAEHCPQGQRGCDRYGRIERLTAPCRPWFGPPGRDRLLAEPDRQAATLPQGSIIFRPVGYPILLLGDVMTAIGIGFEWHSGHPRGLWTGVAPSHLALLSPLCRSRRLWGGATLTSERQVPLSQRRTSSTLPGQAPSPSDRCNKVAAVMKMLAYKRGIKIADTEKKELTEKFSAMPPHPEVPA